MLARLRYDRAFNAVAAAQLAHVLCNGRKFANGTLDSAISVGGNQPYIDNTVYATGVLNSAFNLGGNKNKVTAGPGPFALAGSIFQTGATVTKVGPGFAVGTRVGGAAAVKPKIPAPTATAVRTGRKAAAASAASVGHKT